VEDRPRPWAAPLPRAWADRARALAMPVLLVGIAALGVYRSATLDQSSWQGASFGMFATYDNRSSRAVLVSVLDGPERRQVAMPAELEDDAERLRVVPTDAGAVDLAGEVAAVLVEAGAPFDGVEVEVRRLVVERSDDGLEVRTRRLAHGGAVS
jgi:hypothetical protein